MFILFAKLLWLMYIYYFNLVKIMLSVLKYNLSSAYSLYYVLVKINNLIEPDFSFHLRGLNLQEIKVFLYFRWNHDQGGTNEKSFFN